MLVFTRKRDESAILDLGGGQIAEVFIVDIRGDKVRIGIEAPKDMPVHRREVWEAIKRAEIKGNDKSDAN